MEKLLYSRKETAEALCLSVASIDMMIARGLLRAQHKGARVLVHRDEIARVSLKEIPTIWPAKVAGKTTRNYPGGRGQRPHVRKADSTQTDTPNGTNGAGSRASS
jgi:hypothetical protein